MERREMLKGLAAALGGLVLAQGCSEETEKTEEPEIVGAMCYLVGQTPYMDYICPHCRRTIKGKYSEWTVRYITQIKDFVTKIKKMHYDVVLNQMEFCPRCSKDNIENPELIFKIRFSKKVGYHIVRSNIVNEYQCLYEFLKNPDEFAGDKAIIQKMTGLGEDLKIKK